jgi:probable F420-dependent oxidoreductase
MSSVTKPEIEEPDMDIGVCIFNTDYAIRIEELAREAEARGFESLWVPEHTHIPVSRRTPYPAGGDLPREYMHTLDPFVALTAAAMATTRLRVGTGVVLLPQRDTIVTAKEVASVDFVSNGRFEFGVGGGWNVDEMENHGTVYTTRFRRMTEQVRAMQAIWTEETAEFHGDHVDFDPVWLYPKPVQKPHPPVLFGGETVHTLKRVVAFGDGWFPRARDPERLIAGMADLANLATEAGRDPKTISVSAFGAPGDAAVLDRFRVAGVTRAILRLPSEPRDAILPLLDRHAKLLG